MGDSKDDAEVVLHLVRSSPSVVLSASDRLRSDPDFLLEVMKVRPEALRHAKLDSPQTKDKLRSAFIDRLTP